MTVSSTSSRVVYAGDGSTTSFAFAFYVAFQADLVVTYTDDGGNDTVLSTGQYSISAPAVPPPGWPSGGTITYGGPGGSPCAVGTTLTIERQVAATQPTTISNQGAFWPQVVERALDRIVTVVQGFVDGANRSLKVPASDSVAPNDLPAASLRANQILGFDADGQPQAVTLTTSIVAVGAWVASTFLPQTTQSGARTALAAAGTAAANTFTAANDFTGGSIAVPTAAPGDSDTTAASTAFVAAAIAAALGGAALRGYLAGLGLSRAGNAEIDVAAGVCADSTNAAMLAVSGGTIDCDNTGANGLDTGALANSTTYHAFAIGKTDGTTALLASTSASAPTLPAGYTLQRRLGSFLTDGSAHVRAFVQDGDLFQWLVPDTNQVSVTDPGTSAVTRTADVPTGVSVQAILQVRMNSGGASTAYTLHTDLATTDTAPTSSLTDTSGGTLSAVIKNIRTDTSARIRSRISFSDGSTILKIATLGWIDRRGRDA